jgi:hypothetical protein
MQIGIIWINEIRRMLKIKFQILFYESQTFALLS